MSSGDGDRGYSNRSSSFSNMVGEVSLRITAGCTGRMPYFSLRCACSLGRRHDSKTESSNGVTARREKQSYMAQLTSRKRVCDKADSEWVGGPAIRSPATRRTRAQVEPIQAKRGPPGAQADREDVLSLSQERDGKMGIGARSGNARTLRPNTPSHSHELSHAFPLSFSRQSHPFPTALICTRYSSTPP